MDYIAKDVFKIVIEAGVKYLSSNINFTIN